MSGFFFCPSPEGIYEDVNAPEIDRIFEKYRQAEPGEVIKLELPDSDEVVDARIFEPSPNRPPGHEAGIFVTIPSETEKYYYLDPDASKEKGRLVLKVIPQEVDKKNQAMDTESILSEFERIRNAPDVRRGGGATGETCSKHKGIVDIG